MTYIKIKLDSEKNNESAKGRKSKVRVVSFSDYVKKKQESLETERTANAREILLKYWEGDEG